MVVLSWIGRLDRELTLLIFMYDADMQYLGFPLFYTLQREGPLLTDCGTKHWTSLISLAFGTYCGA
jgi:hypothetical protein